MQFVLGRAHEELKERNQTPSVAGEQLVPEALFHFFDILDKSNLRVILVQEHGCHPGTVTFVAGLEKKTVLALSTHRFRLSVL